MKTYRTIEEAIEEEKKMAKKNEGLCPGCSGTLKPVEGKFGFYVCNGCGGSIALDVYLCDSYDVVSPEWDTTGNVPMEQQRYFDHTFLTGKGSDRRHGWYNVSTKKITQVG